MQMHVLISARFTLSRRRLGHRRIADIVLIIIGVAAFWAVLFIR